MAMKKKINWKSKKTWKTILCIGLAVITLVGAIVGISALFRKSEETTKTMSPSYAIGGLTEKGTYLETKESIYTKNAFECYGLKTSLTFDNDISYKLYFYDENNEFIESTEKLTTAFDSSKTNMPALTKYCRVVITPNDDSKISWYEKSSYAKQLTIKVNKDQTKSVGVAVYLKNYFELDNEHVGTIICTTEYILGSSLKYSEMSDHSCSKAIDVSGLAGSTVRITYSKVHSTLVGGYLFADVNNEYVDAKNFMDNLSEYSFTIPSNASFLYVNIVDGYEPIVNIITD